MQKEEISLEGICILCGKKIKIKGKKWVCPLCEECLKKVEKNFFINI